MMLDEAGRLQEMWKAKYGNKLCHHTRVVDCLTGQDGQTTEKLVCRECGGIFLDPLKPRTGSSTPD